MKKLFLMLAICALFSCKKNKNNSLENENWKVASISVSPAMTIGSKTSTDFMELSGANSCAANMTLSFAKNGTFGAGSTGALCDMITTTDIKTWRKDGNQIYLSTAPNNPLILNNETLTQTTTSNPIGGIVYTFVYTYKAQ